MFKIEWGCDIRKLIEGIKEGRKKKKVHLIFRFFSPGHVQRFTVIIPADTINFQTQPECLTLEEMSSLHLQT